MCCLCVFPMVNLVRADFGTAVSDFVTICCDLLTSKSMSHLM